MQKTDDIKEKAYNIIPSQELALIEELKAEGFRKITRGEWRFEPVIIKMYIPNNYSHPSKEEILKTILAKAEIMAKMGQQSQYFVGLRGVVLEDDCYALVLESVANDLSQVLQQRPQDLNWKVCCQIATGVAVGLFRLHEKKITHGNLKSRNVLLTPDFQPKLTSVGSHHLHLVQHLILKQIFLILEFYYWNYLTLLPKYRRSLKISRTPVRTRNQINARR